MLRRVDIRRVGRHVRRNMSVGKSDINLVHMHGRSMLEQLRIEESLYRAGEGNWCIVNRYVGEPVVVLGISGKPEELVYLNKTRHDNIPLIKRYSGGGTVVLSPGTFIVSFVCGKEALSDGRARSPSQLMDWSSAFYKTVFQRAGSEEAFNLRVQDYTLGTSRKIGGNAQALSKNRWVHHTSFLWDYDSSVMQYLRIPEKQPDYRSNRSHSDFLTKISLHVDRADRWWNAFESVLDDYFYVTRRTWLCLSVVLR